MKSWEQLAIEAVSHFEAGNISEAKELFEEALSLHPTESWPFIKYADLLLKQSDPNQALEILNKTSPKCSNKWRSFLRIEALEAIGNFKESEKLALGLHHEIGEESKNLRIILERLEAKIKARLPEDFCVSDYKQIYLNGQNMSEYEAANHFLTVGKKEKRVYKVIPIKPLHPSFNLPPPSPTFLRLYALDEDWVHWDNLEFQKTRAIYTFEILSKYFSCLVGNLIFKKRFTHDEAIKISSSYPITHYDIVEVSRLNNDHYDNDLLNPDLLKVYVPETQETKLVVYPFLSFPNKGLRQLPDPKINFEKRDWDYNFINLDERKDKLEQTLDNLKGNTWLIPRRVKAIKHEKGWIGCLLSHLEVLKKSQHKNANVLIAEDDNIIIDGEKLKKILQILDTHCFDWDVFLGSVGLPTVDLSGVLKIGDVTLYNVVNVSKANFIYYNKAIVPKILKLESFFSQFNSNLKYYDRFFNLFNVFTSDGVCTVRNNFSDIENTHTIPEARQIEYTYQRLKIKERIFSHSLPADFSPEDFRELNPDLAKLSDSDLTQYFLHLGHKQHRSYRFELPEDFNWEIYSALNQDLSGMSPLELKLHYVNHGHREMRTYHDPWFDTDYFTAQHQIENSEDAYQHYLKDIRQSKNNYFDPYVSSFLVDKRQQYIFLVNHDDSGYGAGRYLYQLFKVLSQQFPNITFKLCETKYNPKLELECGISASEVLEYQSDPTLLFKLYERFNPCLVYFNSCNFAMTKLVDFIPKTKLILHSHEIFEHYLLSKRLVPDFVVSERIADQYEQHFQLRPNIQPPFLLNSKEILRMAEEPVEPIKNECGIMDLSKVTLCMCGQINERKNFNLFIEVAKRCPQYNFLWIGGTEDPFENIENVFHVKYTSNPYKYFKNIVDYFVLFSKQDPCPYVILENILLETQIVTFRENIFFDHKHRLTKEFYFEYPGAISLENVINALKLYVKGKKTKSISQEGLHYIEEFFRFPSAIIQSVETHLKGTFYRDELMSF